MEPQTQSQVLLGNKSWEILRGDCTDVLGSLPDCSVQCVITSPPYFKHRDYKHVGQLGSEKTPQAYVNNIVEVFREVRRVLRYDGTLWLNLGDTFAKANCPGFKKKDLMGIPWMVALALRADGWYLRADCIWEKRNPVPHSVMDRPVPSHEYVFLLAKSDRYFYDREAVKEPGVFDKAAPRNKRTVWTLPTQPFHGAHCAPFPEKLVETCLLAGTSERGCCGKCGAAFKRILKKGAPVFQQNSPGTTKKIIGAQGRVGKTSTLKTGTVTPYTTVGWKRTCACSAERVGCIVLDPFSGAGTTGVVCRRRYRRYIGIELNPDFADLSEQRISKVEPPPEIEWVPSPETPREVPREPLSLPT